MDRELNPKVSRAYTEMQNHDGLLVAIAVMTMGGDFLFRFN